MEYKILDNLIDDNSSKSNISASNKMKKLIIDYLKSGYCICYIAGDNEPSLFSDGKWVWSMDLIKDVNKGLIKNLPLKFIEYALDWKVPQLTKEELIAIELFTHGGNPPQKVEIIPRKV